jgi:hypothetical protein
MKGVQEYVFEVTGLPLFKQQLTNQHTRVVEERGHAITNSLGKML